MYFVKNRVIKVILGALVSVLCSFPVLAQQACSTLTAVPAEQTCATYYSSMTLPCGSYYQPSGGVSETCTSATLQSDCTEANGKWISATQSCANCPTLNNLQCVAYEGDCDGMGPACSS